MTLTNVSASTTANWAAQINEADVMAALHAGLQAMYPGQVPDLDMQEVGDNFLLKNNGGNLLGHARGTITMSVEIRDVEPA